MFLSPMPFDYVKKIDPGDRLRRTSKSDAEARVRRLPRETGK